MEEIGGDDSYVIFDCPGHIELYSHVPAMRQIVEALQRVRFRVCAVYLLDAQFVADVSKFVSGVLCCISVRRCAAQHALCAHRPCCGTRWQHDALHRTPRRR